METLLDSTVSLARKYRTRVEVTDSVNTLAYYNPELFTTMKVLKYLDLGRDKLSGVTPSGSTSSTAAASASRSPTTHPSSSRSTTLPKADSVFRLGTIQK